MSIINSFSRASFSLALMGAAVLSACGDDGDDTDSDAAVQASSSETTGGNAPRAGSSSTPRAGRGGSSGSTAAAGRGTAGTSAGAAGRRAAADSGSGGRRGLPPGAAGTGTAGTAGAAGTAGIGEADDAGVSTRPIIDLSDGQIAEIASTANAGEITLGMVAVTRAQTGPVRDYAQSMVSAHTAAQSRQTALVNTLGITASPSSVSQQLSENAAATLMQLQNASVTDFDILYVRSQVDMHMQVLQSLDEQLLPNVSVDALRAELVVTRTEVQAHLESARALLTTLEGIDVSDAGVGVP